MFDSSVMKKNIPVLCVLTVVICWSLFVFNKTAIPSEGWYQVYADMILAGKVPYSDFELAFPPLYTGIITLYTIIFGGNLISFRILGIIIFVSIALLFYTLFSKLFDSKISAICTILIMFITQDVGYIMYDYSQVYTLLNISSFLVLLTVLIKKREHIDFKTDLYFVSIGLLVSCSFLARQSSGLIIIALYFVIMLISKFIEIKITKKEIGFYLIGLLIPLLILTIWVVATNNIDNFLNEVFFSGVKGSLVEMASRWIISTFAGWQYYLLLSVIVCSIWIAKTTKFDYSNKRILFMIIASITILAMLTLYFNDPSSISGWGQWCYLLLIAASILLMIAPPKIMNFISNNTLLIISVIVIVVISIAMFSNKGTAGMFNIKDYYNTLVFLGICILFIYYIWKTITSVKNKKHMSTFDACMLILTSFYLAVSFGCGTSGGLSVNQCGFGFGIVLALCLKNIRKIKIENAVKKLETLFVVFTILFAGSAIIIKTGLPYDWWGLTEVPYSECTSTTDISYFEGIYMSSEEKSLYETFMSDINKYVNDDDEIYCYSQIPIFYKLANKIPTVKAPVCWFDVCRDSTALSDLEYIQNNNPKLIVFADHGEYVISSHEQSFRSGHTSGQREIYNWLLDCTEKGECGYEVVDTCYLNGYPFYILVKTN